MAEALGHSGEVGKRLRIRRKTLRGLPEHRFRFVISPRKRQRAAVESQRLAAGGGLCDGDPERFERLSQIARILPLLRSIEPDPAKRRIDTRVVFKALRRPSQRDHSAIAIASAQVRAPDSYQALGLGRIESIERVELLDFVARALLEPMQIGELFTGDNERGGEINSALKCDARW